VWWGQESGVRSQKAPAKSAMEEAGFASSCLLTHGSILRMRNAIAPGTIDAVRAYRDVIAWRNTCEKADFCPVQLVLRVAGLNLRGRA